MGSAGKIEKFEDILGWQSGREVCRLVYQLTKIGSFSRDYGLRDQMRRAAVSIISNIAEGYESQNNRTFIRYLFIAKGSAAEARAQAYVALDQGYITQENFDTLYQLTDQTSRRIRGLITYLEQHPDGPNALSHSTQNPQPTTHNP
ncbi:MAG: four helix bundle protein [Anaerolineae bacterium]|nr:four helix bundle protein [Anaerolineae bacterium]